MKIFYRFLSTFLILSFVSSFWIAPTHAQQAPLYQLEVFEEEIPESVEVDDLATLIQEGQDFIDQRLDNLYYLKKSTLQFVRGIKKTPQGTAYGFTSDQVRSLLNLVNPQIRGLKLLKRKIKFGKDEEKVRGYVQAIFTDYRIFAIFVPKYSLTEGFFKLQNRLNQVRDTLKDRNTFAQHEQTLIDLESQIQENLKKILALMPADYEGEYEAILTEVADALSAIQQSIEDLLL